MPTLHSSASEPNHSWLGGILLRPARRPVVACLLLGALAWFTGCSAREGGRPPSTPHVLQFAMSSEPATLDPLISSTDNEFYLEEAVFDGLLKYDPRGRLIPDLALQVPSPANGGISPDLKTVTYHLRRGVRWQDGAPFTSRDVAWTYRLVMDDRTASPLRSLYESIVSLQTPSPYTVVVHLRKSSLATIQDVFVAGLGFIVPEHVLRSVGNIRRADFNSHPVGTGPYSVRAWKRGDRIDLSANAHYFLGAPRIRDLRVLFEPAPATRAALLKTGAVDIASVGVSALRELRGAPVRVVRTRSNDVFYVDLNTRAAPLEDQAVREALALALDRARIAGLLGVEPAYGLMPPSPGVRAPGASMSVEKANALLRRAGWVSGSDGIRRRAGEVLRVDLLYTPGPAMERTALLVQQAWSRIGVRTTLRALPYGALFGEHGLVYMGRYAAALDGLGITRAGDITQIIGSSSTPPAGFNYSRYDNPQVDSWLARADATGDSRVRTQLYARVHRAIRRDVPVIPLFWGTYERVVNRRVHGFEPEPVVSDFWNVATWSLE